MGEEKEKERGDILVLLSHKVITTYDIVTNLLDFDDKRVYLQRIIVGYLSK